MTRGARANREHPLSAQLTGEVIDLEPFRETGWQALMRAYAEAGTLRGSRHV